MALIVVGVSHHSAPIAVREKVAVGPGELAHAAAELRDRCGAREAVLLSTCNRTELYLVEGDRRTDGAVPSATEWLTERLGVDAAPYAHVRRDREAAAHLFRVASGIDSMVLGEAQIHGQVRDAWERARPASGAVLNRLFQTSLMVASRVRVETAIGRGAASVSSAAVQLAKQIFGDLAGRRAMILGAGEMAELALECLADEGVQAAVVANRTYERAAELAARHGARAVHYETCWAELREVDLLICSTAAPHAVVTPSVVAPALAGRGSPVCILDIALPRDVDPAVGELDNVFLYDLDDLQRVVATNLERRRKELPSAESLIGAEVEKYWQWVAGLAAVPVVTGFRAAMERRREEELALLLRRLGPLDESQRAAVEQFSRSLMNKFLHEPSVRLKAAAANGRGLAVVDAARYLFALDDEAAGSAAAPGTPGHTHDDTHG